jgi:hypothetical protein
VDSCIEEALAEPSFRREDHKYEGRVGVKFYLEYSTLTQSGHVADATILGVKDQAIKRVLERCIRGRLARVNIPWCFPRQDIKGWGCWYFVFHYDGTRFRAERMALDTSKVCARGRVPEDSVESSGELPASARDGGTATSSEENAAPSE